MWKIIVAALLLVAGCQPMYSDPAGVPLREEWSSSVLAQSEKIVLGRCPYPDSAQISGMPEIKALYFPSLNRTKVFVDGRITYKNIRGYGSQAFFSIQFDSPGNANVTGSLSPTMSNIDFSDAYLNATGDLPSP